MMAILRKALLRRRKTPSLPVRLRPRTLGAAMERLESRTLLSLAPAVVDSAPPAMLPAPAFHSVSARTVAPMPSVTLPGFEAAPAVGGVPAGDWGWERPEFDFEVLPMVPDTVPPELGDDDQPGLWLPLPGSGEPGGYLNLEDGQSRDQGPDVLLSSGGTATQGQEVQAVREMLSALKYAPSDSPEKKPLADLPAKSESDTSPPPQATAAGPRPHPTDEGGMVEIVRDAAIGQIAAQASPALPEIESLLSVPVKMDRAYGKFQAFEVSTGEEVPQLPAPPPNAAALPADSGAPALPAFEGFPTALSEQPSTELEQFQCAADRVVIDEELLEEEAALTLAPPRKEEEAADSSTYAAALVFFVVVALRETYAARAASPGDIDEPEALLPRR